MSTRRIRGLAFAAIALMLIDASASAQLADRRTFFTFNTPVDVPGVALPPGKYLFRVAEPDGGGKIVQVLSADGQKVHAAFFSIPAGRPEPAEAPARTQALLLARAASEPVLTTQGVSMTADQTDTTDLARVSANGQETQVKAGTKPTAAAPRGQAQQGEAAPSSLTISSQRESKKR